MKFSRLYAAVGGKCSKVPPLLLLLCGGIPFRVLFACCCGAPVCDRAHEVEALVCAPRHLCRVFSVLLILSHALI